MTGFTKEPAFPPERQRVERTPVELAARVVLLVNGRAFGGVQQHSLNLASVLQRRGVDVLIVAPPGHAMHGRAAAAGIATRSLQLGLAVGKWRGYLGTLAFLSPLSRRHSLQVLKSLASEAPTIFVCPNPREQILTASMSRTLVTKGVWVLHAPFVYMPHRLVLWPIWLRYSRRADAVVAVSSRLASSMRAAGVPAATLHVVPNAVGVQPTLEVKRTDGLIGTVTRLVSAKGIQHLIAAMPEILRQHPEAHLEIVGTGRYERELRGLVQRLKLSDHVRFVGYVSDPLAFLRRVSVFVHPTQDPGEVLPTAILEAESVGTPVVASAIAGIPDQVIPEVTGILTPPGDAAALAAAVNTLLDDPAKARTMGAAGQQLVERQYSLDQMGDSFLELLAGLESQDGGDPTGRQ